MNRIAIATLQGINYGCRLQNFALQTAIEKKTIMLCLQSESQK